MSTFEWRKQQRMAEDARRVRAVDEWPLPFLPVKTQPWIAGQMRLGRIREKHLTTVVTEEGFHETFGSIEELVETWSVD